MIRLRADFNGLFGDLLCLSHGDTCRDEAGNEVSLAAGMRVMAFEPDTDDDGQPADLIATGVVELSPDWLQCNGSRWALRIDEHGVRHQSDADIQYHLHVTTKVRSGLERADTEGAIEQDEAEARLSKWIDD
jgi:hypothetical protein